MQQRAQFLNTLRNDLPCLLLASFRVRIFAPTTYKAARFLKFSHFFDPILTVLARLPIDATNANHHETAKREEFRSYLLLRNFLFKLIRNCAETKDF